MSIIGLVISIILFSFLFALMGLSIYNNYIFKEVKNNALVYGLTYFQGMAIFLAIWRIISYITRNVQVSLYLIIIISLIIIIIAFDKKHIKDDLLELYVSLQTKKYYIMCLIVLVFIFENLLFTSWFKTLTPFTTIGSLHSIRYANISTYILEYNRIPIIGQNYGQSMLASIPMMIGFNIPLLALNCWLSLTMVNFIILVYGMFKTFNLTKKSALIGTFIVMFGNTALSISHVLVIDSGSPFILNGYTDSISSIGTFIFFIVYIKNIYLSDNKYKISMMDIITLFTLSIYWNIGSPQNIIFAIILLSILIIYSTIRKKSSRNNTINIMIMTILFSSIGILQGGMFTPTQLKEVVNLPGMMEVQKNTISVQPELPYLIGSAGTWESATNLNTSDKYFTKESNISNEIRAIFWPLVGVVGLCLIVNKNKVDKEELIKQKMLCFISAGIIGVGLSIAYPFAISGFKWELSRFMILGYFFGMFSLVVFMNYCFNIHKLSKNIIILITAVIVAGPIYNAVLTIIRILFDTNNSLVFIERLKMLFKVSGIIN